MAIFSSRSKIKQMPARAQQEIAIVAIGRNEGERLKSCLRSLHAEAGEDGTRTIVYVDSGSKDGSAAYAASVGCEVVELDPARPFSAARARNEGFARLMELAPEVRYIQFLDGDCDLVEGWLEHGKTALEAHPEVGLVCGNVRELHPEASIYNRLCDLEWQQQPGEIRSSGGRFLVRTEVFRAVGGFRADVIAAEDDEFCIRVRAQGWKILQLDAEMARHDINMTHFSEWWRRSKRTGHAFAQVASLHGRGEERYFVPDIQRIWTWALVLPLLALVLAPVTRGWSLLLLALAYGLQFARTYQRSRKRWIPRDALIYATFTALFKFPALIGLIEYYWRHRRGDAFTIIEYRRSS